MILLLLQYILNLLVAIDRLCNTLLGGTPDQTMSQRLWRDYPNSVLRQVVDFIFGKSHCEDAVEKDDDVKALVK